MNDNFDVNASNLRNRSFRHDDAACNHEELGQAHLRLSCLDGVKEIMLEDEPERFVSFCD